MLWRWISLPAILSAAMLSGAQEPPQPFTAPTPGDIPQSEISTRVTDATIKVRVNLVLVRVVVRDAQGNAVPDLKQEDFQVFDNGKRQKISAFSAETPETQANAAAETLPEAAGTEPTAEAAKASVTPQRFLALVFDDLHMKAADEMAVHAAAQKLFATLTPTDRVAIYSLEGKVQQDFTADGETLRKTLAAIVPHPAKGESQYECPNITYYQADLIVNKHDRDAMQAAAIDAGANDCSTDIRATAQRILDEEDSRTRDGYRRLDDVVKHLAAMPGQRVLAYVSPGFILDDAVLPDGSHLIEQAIRAGVVVNTIDARGLYTAGMLPDIGAPPQVAPDSRVDSTVDYQAMESRFRMQAQFQSGQVLAEMAADTGGRFFHNRNDLDVAMNQALAPPSVSYVLGFAPQKPADGKFHSLKVKLANGRRYEVQARNGYYTAKKSSNPEDQAEQEVREALFSQDEIAGVPVQLKTELLQAGATSARLTVFAHLGISAIHFRKTDGRNCNDLVFAIGVFDTNGRITDGQTKQVALKLQDSTLQKMSRTGLTFKAVFSVKPGTYRVRGVVRDSEDDPLTARNLLTVIPANPSQATVKKVSFQNMRWAPPNVDAPLKSLPTDPICNLSEVLVRTGASALDFAQNLETFTAQDHIDYATLDRAGMVEDYDSGSFQYVYSIEQQNGGGISREYRTPLKGSHVFPAIGQDVGGAAIALMFLPDLQTDYAMTCEGLDQRNGQLDWVVHFEQRKDRPSRTAKVWVSNVARPGAFEGRAWISKDNFQVVHLEASLMDGIPEVELRGLAVSVDYRLVQNPSGNRGFWLPDKIATYWDYDAHRTILDHGFSDFQFFSVATQEEVREPKAP